MFSGYTLSWCPCTPPCTQQGSVGQEVKSLLNNFVKGPLCQAQITNLLAPFPLFEHIFWQTALWFQGNSVPHHLQMVDFSTFEPATWQWTFLSLQDWLQESGISRLCKQIAVLMDMRIKPIMLLGRLQLFVQSDSLSWSGGVTVHSPAAECKAVPQVYAQNHRITE